MDKILYLDIETLAADESKYEALRYLYERKLEKKRKNKEMSDEVIIEDEKAGFDAYVKGTSFDGGFGRILCIAYAINDNPIQIICNPDNEAKTLQRFWEVAKDVNLFVGHNVMDFDLRFIYQRSIVLRIRPSRNLSFARYRSEPIYDTMKEWVKWAYNSNVGLEHLALSLGIPTPKEGIDGSQVSDFYKAGKIKEICEYCQRDVETTRAIYRKMNFLI